MNTEEMIAQAAAYFEPFDSADYDLREAALWLISELRAALARERELLTPIPEQKEHGYTLAIMDNLLNAPEGSNAAKLAMIIAQWGSAVQALKRPFKPITSAPTDDKTWFWGLEGHDLIRMRWHSGFKAFCSTWRIMTMAHGYLIDGKQSKEHSPTTHSPEWWIPLFELPEGYDPYKRY